VSYAQTDSVKWALTSDTNAVTIGNVGGYTEVFSSLVIRSYNGGVCQKSAPTIAGDWIAESAQNDTRYLQFAASPSTGYNFTVTTIAFTIGWAGSTGHVFANVYYSTDSTFTAKTQLGSTIILQNSTGAVNGSTSLNIIVNSGQTLYVRFYPWDNQTATTKSMGIAGFVIAGTAATVGSPSFILTPSSISFGTIKVNTTKDNYFTLSGSILNPASDSIRISAPSNFIVSTTLGSGYSSRLALPYSDSTFSLDTVFVRFAPSVIKVYSDSILVSGGGTTTHTIYASGTAVDPSTILGIFVSTTGSDTNAGTYSAPFLTVQKAISIAQAGDSIYLRAGTYINNSTINISSSGTALNRIALYAYPPDSAHPFLDFSSMAYSSSNHGVNLAGNYWHIKGLDVFKAGDNGLFTSGSYDIIEFCAFHENRDGGCQIGGGASYNQFINCDSYFNYDSVTTGSNADGFSPKLDVGTGNYFYGCRAWQNSDDGWDGYLRPSDDVTTTIENCWSFMNGYLKDGVTTFSNMNGNGFKMGGSDAKNFRHNMVVKNCLSFLNKSKGFDQNSNMGSMTILNCTAYKNGLGDGKPNFYVSLALATGKVLTVENCIALGSTGVTLSIPGTFVTNSWASPFTEATATDFISVDTTGVRGPRKPDGSLPDITFMHLVSNSQFVDAGINVGLPYIGRAPDLGCFESNVLTGVIDQNNSLIRHAFTLYQNYPNPFNPSTEIRYSVPTISVVKLSIYNILGQEVTILVNEQMQPGNYSIQWNATRMSSGLYFTRLSAQTGTGQSFLQTCKMLLIK
jgi:hypothetical protein